MSNASLMPPAMARAARGFLPACLLLATMLVGCAPSPPGVPALEGRWRGELMTPGGALPFGIEFGRDEQGALAAWYLNGAERAPVTEVSLEGDQLVLAIPALASRIGATLDERGLTGQLELLGRGAETAVIPFSARPADYRFYPTPAPASLDMNGRWQAEFLAFGQTIPAVGEFVQEGSRVTGTFLTPTGDYRFLEGEVRDRELYLSTFAGGHVFLFRATEGPGGVLVGQFWSGLGEPQSWTAVADPVAELPDPWSRTRIAGDRFEFAFPDPQGQPVSLADPRFAGQVVIVTIAGSWCPNSHDEAAFIVPFVAANADRGLAAVGLMFEHHAKFELASEALRHYQAHQRIDFPLLVAGTSNRRQASAALRELGLEGVVAFPTTVVLDRQHRVRRVHTGFRGPATGEHYEQWQSEFTAFIDELLAEPPPG
ncbi:MAG: TlpA family protein disulfide reductase [Chromatiales bacterium]|nr:TlpA family protein disulfide reductase [Chromatiales bacterium]